MRPRAYHQLWDLAVELAPTVQRGWKVDPEVTFDCPSVGLILRQKEGRNGYNVTPLDVDTFAGTGGDGVHFSFLQLEGRSPEAYPIVMTVPMCFDGNCNVIVGANLIEFLSLGCDFGYFALEQLAYDWDGTIREIESGVKAYSGSPDEDRLRRTLNERFELEPWPEVAMRLRDLRNEFLPLIRLPERK